MWYSIEQAAALKRVNTRQIYRLIQSGKLQSQQMPDGTQVWIDATPPSPLPPLPQGEGKEKEIQIPSVPQCKITEEVTLKVEGMLLSVLATVNITAVEQDVQTRFGINVSTQRKYKRELRLLYNLQERSSLASAMSGLSDCRQALEYIITRESRSDKNTLRAAKGLSVIVPNTGELISVEEFLKSLYPREGVNATSCYRALRARCIKKQVVKTPPESSPSKGEDKFSVATIEELPSEGRVRMFLKKWRQEVMSVRRGRSRKHDWETQQEPFVTRDVTQYCAGELWIGDHTELDFMVLNEEEKPDRRWISSFIDIRTGLIVGYHLSWQPNSNTIALAFRNGVLGLQLHAFTGETYQPVQLQNTPETVMMDNGKDYRSKYTQRVFGKIDFEDDARKSINRITKLQYVLPYHGQSKAQMERWFKTIQTMLKYLPGFKGNKYQNTPDSLKTEMKQGELLRVEDFDAHVALGINAYNNRIHRTLKNQTPIQCYLTNMTQQRTIDQRVLDFLMVKVSNRVIRRCQVTLLGNEYYSDALMVFNGKHADIYYNPNDVGFISIYVSGEFAAVACNKELIGQDERSWLRILNERKRGEKTMQEQLTQFKRGISSADAKRMLLEGELLNTEAVSQELLSRVVPNVTVLTGLEQEAIHQQEKIDQAKEFVEVEREAKRRKKKMVVNYNLISENF